MLICVAGSVMMRIKQAPGHLDEMADLSRYGTSRTIPACGDKAHDSGRYQRCGAA